MAPSRRKNLIFFGTHLALLAWLATSGVPAAFAVYDQPVTWADMSTVDLTGVLRSQYASETNLMESPAPASAMDVVMEDADHRIAKEFKIPAELKNSVHFWLRIYTEISTEQLAIFDAHHPELVYEILDFRPLAKSARNRMVYEIMSQRKAKHAVAAYRRAFAHLRKDSNPKSPTPEETKILAALKTLKTQPTMKSLASGLKIQSGQRDNIVKGLLAAEAYLPRIEKIFASLEVPPELSRLSLVESSFDLKAVSKADAVGVWQFLPQSGKEYLTIDSQLQVDERISPIKASVAAAKLLKRNYKTLGSWPLAITAYNHGTRLFVRAARRGKTPEETIKKYLGAGENRSPLGWASRNYYAEFLAVVHAEAYRSLFYGETPFSTIAATSYVRLPRAQSAQTFASAHGLTPKDFRNLNPDVRNMKTHLPKGFWLAIPGDVDNLASLAEQIRPKIVKAKKVSTRRAAVSTDPKTRPRQKG